MQNDEPLKIDVALEVESTDSLIAINFLLDNVNLSKSRLKDMMNKGAVWLTRGKKSKKRLRRAMTDLEVGDILQVYYDEQVLALKPRALQPVADKEAYSVWHKPAGMLTQGNEWGDHTSLLRVVELFFNPKREAFLVHRLEREAQGLIIIGHNRRIAADFSEMFRKGSIRMQYRIEVRGDISKLGAVGEIDIKLDDQTAKTRYKQVRYESEKNYSVVDVWLDTGRKHQIRRHFNESGFPVMGDPRYGNGNKNETGMKLHAVSLEFNCPVSGKPVRFSAFDQV